MNLMASKWHRFWTYNADQIESGVLKWRQEGFARVPLPFLCQVSRRHDIYHTCIKVTSHGIKRGIDRHKLELASVLMPALQEDEVVVARIRNRDGSDYLELLSE